MRLREGLVRSPRPEMEGASVSHPLCDDLAANAPDCSAVGAEPELSNKFAAVAFTGSWALAGADGSQHRDPAEKGERMDSRPSGSTDEGVEKVGWGVSPYQLSALSAPPFLVAPPLANAFMDVDVEWGYTPRSSLTYVRGDGCAMDIDASSGDVEDQDVAMGDCTIPGCG